MKLMSLKRHLILGALVVLGGCGGGGGASDPAPAGGSDTGTRVALDDGGVLVFAAGGTAAKPTVTVQEAPSPILIPQLRPLGRAWHVEVVPQPLQPVEIRLPVPAGEDPDALAIVRVDDGGEITLLQTEVDGGYLVALADGFSTVVATRLEDELATLRPSITGPNVLPVGLAGEYQEDGFKGVPGLQRAWSLKEYGATMANSSDEGLTLTSSTSPLGNSRALLEGDRTADALLSVQFKEPSTGINVVARKPVRIQQGGPAIVGSALDLAIFGPAIVRRGDKFNLTARVLNGGASRIARWACTFVPADGSASSDCGSCDGACEASFTVNGLSVSDLGRAAYILAATSTASEHGSVSLTIAATDDAPFIDAVEVQAPPNRWSQFGPPVPFTAQVQVGGGLPPYSYQWSLSTEAAPRRPLASSFDVDSFDFSLDQPGSFWAQVTVTDSTGKKTSAKDYFSLPAVDGEQAVRATLGGVPADEVLTNAMVNLQLKAHGGELIGVLGAEYLYEIDWGDGSALQRGQLDAARVQDGTSVTLGHSYSAPGTYRVRFAARHAYEAHFFVFGLIDFLQSRLAGIDRSSPAYASLQPSLTEATIKVVAQAGTAVRPAEDICPPSVSVVREGAVQRSFTFARLVHPSTKGSSCQYENPNVAGVAVELGLSYQGHDDAEPDGACGATAQGGVLYETRRARSVQRTLTVETITSLSLGFAPLPVLLIEEEMLTGMVVRGVEIGLGEPCP